MTAATAQDDIGDGGTIGAELRSIRGVGDPLGVLVLMTSFSLLSRRADGVVTEIWALTEL